MTVGKGCRYHCRTDEIQLTMRPKMLERQAYLSIALVAFCWCFSRLAEATISLCSANEEIEFSCETKKGLISICLSESEQGKGLQYRFGTAGNIELSYPSRPSPFVDVFRVGTLMYSGGGGAYVKFKNKSFDYTVFSSVGRWGKDGELTDVAGVVVKKGAKPIAKLQCKDPPQSSLGSSLFKRLGLKADDQIEEFEIPDSFLQN